MLDITKEKNLLIVFIICWSELDNDIINKENFPMIYQGNECFNLVFHFVHYCFLMFLDTNEPVLLTFITSCDKFVHFHLWQKMFLGSSYKWSTCICFHPFQEVIEEIWLLCACELITMQCRNYILIDNLWDVWLLLLAVLIRIS